MFTSIKRVIKSGYLAFSRNSGLSFATISIMVMTIFLITFLILLNTSSKILISDIQEKIDISIYFKKYTLPDDILLAKEELSQLDEISYVEFISEEKALENFTAKHKSNSVIMESLKEVGGNPFLASLNVRVWQPSYYEKVNNFVEESEFNYLVEKVDYYQRKSVIDRIFVITSAINKGGVFFSVILGFISILVTFSAIKIAIHNMKDEISIMKLVGASNWFVRGPFLVQGVISGIMASVLALALTFILVFSINSKVSAIAPQISAINLLLNNLGIIFLIQIGIGITLGIISSMLGIRKYLRV